MLIGDGRRPEAGREYLRAILMTGFSQKMSWAANQNFQKYSNNLGIIKGLEGRNSKKTKVCLDRWGEHLLCVNYFSRSNDRVLQIIHLSGLACDQGSIFAWLFSNKLTGLIYMNIRIKIHPKKHRPSTMERKLPISPV